MAKPKPPSRKPSPTAGRLSAEAAVTLARQLIAQRDFTSAGRCLADVLARWPNHTAALHTQAVLLNMQGQSAQAVPVMAQLLQQRANDAGAWNDYGLMLASAGQPEQAIDAWERCLALAPEAALAAKANNNLGRLYQETEPERAEQAFRRATELSPRFAPAWYQLSQLLPRLGRIAESVDAWAQATVLAPEQASTEHHARALLHLGRLPEAIAVYQDWLQREPGNPVARHHLAALCTPDTAERASDAYVETVFDGFAANFDEKLALLAYQAPRLVRDALAVVLPLPQAGLQIADAGCGTGLCGPLLAPWADQLVGFDLSGEMLKRAEARGVYTALHKAELVQFLAAQPAVWDVVVSADTLCYFAALGAPLSAAFSALRPGGYLLFTVEADAADADTHRLLPNGRYAHSQAHVRAAAAQVGFAVLALSPEKLREEAGQAVNGWLLTLQRPPSPPHPAA